MTSSAPRTVCYDWAKTFSLHPRRGRQHPRLTPEPVVIDYETFSKIHDCHDEDGRHVGGAFALRAAAQPAGRQRP
jgi:hypothetical protein